MLKQIVRTIIIIILTVFLLLLNRSRLVGDCLLLLVIVHYWLIPICFDIVIIIVLVISSLNGHIVLCILVCCNIKLLFLRGLATWKFPRVSKVLVSLPPYHFCIVQRIHHDSRPSLVALMRQVGRYFLKS